MHTFKCNENDKSLIDSFYREIYEENEYNRFGVKVDTNDIVLDLGANVGIFSKYALELGAGKVIAYESDSNTYEYLKENIQDEKAELYLGAIGHNLITISDIIQRHNLDKVDFIKLDVEGYEWELLKNIDSTVFDVVDKWIIEFHTLHNNNEVSWQHKFNILFDLLRIIELFSKNGYKLYFEHVHKQWDVVMLYVKKDIQPN